MYEHVAQTAMSNYDPHFLFITSKNSNLPLNQRIKGLLIFSQETNVRREPKIDQEKVEVSYGRVFKVVIHHISAIDES